MDLVFVDVETTGLDPQVDTILEIALIKEDRERTWWIELSSTELGEASPRALQVNRYYERSQGSVLRGDGHLNAHVPLEGNARQHAARSIAVFTDSCVLAGNTVKFDQQFLEAWMRRHGSCPVWDYHIVDVPTFCAGYLTKELDPDSEGSEELVELLKPPFKSNNVAKAIGLPEMDEADMHTALGDARRAKQMWQAVTS